jgi:hypothetical protein
VLVLCGNHEYYGGTVEDTHALVRSICARAPDRNLVFLDRGRHLLADGTAVLGATLWSDVQPAQASDVRCFLSDFRRISGWSLDANQAAHRLHLQWLRGAIQEAELEGRKVVPREHGGQARRKPPDQRLRDRPGVPPTAAGGGVVLRAHAPQ